MNSKLARITTLMLIASIVLTHHIVLGGYNDNDSRPSSAGADIGTDIDSTTIIEFHDNLIEDIYASGDNDGDGFNDDYNNNIDEPLHNRLAKSVEALSEEPDDLSAASQTRAVFELFKLAFKRTYVSAVEASRRFTNFAGNLMHVRRSMRDFAVGRASFALGINNFADWDESELKSLAALKRPKAWPSSPFISAEKHLEYHNSNSEPGDAGNNETTTTELPRVEPESAEDNEFKRDRFPLFVDWRRSQCVLSPVNQGRCGACYAFATLSVVETMQCLRRRRRAYRLSPQQLVDCVEGSEASGCSGGWPGEVLEHFVRNTTIVSLARCYPYTGEEGKCKLKALYKNRRARANCLLKASPSNTKLRYREVHTKRAMMHYLATIGPLVGAIEATASFSRYSHGVYNEPECKNGNVEHVNHAIAVIGYGNENGTDYWLIKNSWGAKWGLNGYGKVLRGSNECSIESIAWTVLE